MYYLERGMKKKIICLFYRAGRHYRLMLSCVRGTVDLLREKTLTSTVMVQVQNVIVYVHGWRLVERVT